jgi:hypothetical protein
MHFNWRQVRIFTSDFSPQWYLGLLARFAVPFATEYPDTPFWFTRYTGDRKLGANDDVADTSPNNLAVPYLNAAQEHRSIRFRFSPLADEEAFLESRRTPTFWYSEFLPFNALKNFSEGRFGSSDDVAARKRRAMAVGRLLHTNCRFVLDVLEQDNGVWRFASNADNLNRFSGNPFQTMIHLMSQVMGPDGATPLPLYWRDPANGAPIPACIT